MHFIYTLYTYSILNKCLYTQCLLSNVKGWKVPKPCIHTGLEQEWGIGWGCVKSVLSVWFAYSRSGSPRVIYHPYTCSTHCTYKMGGGYRGLLCINSPVCRPWQTPSLPETYKRTREIGQDPPKGGFGPWGRTHQLAPIIIYTYWQEIFTW